MLRTAESVSRYAQPVRGSAAHLYFFDSPFTSQASS
jgi:hypothetical protein